MKWLDRKLRDLRIEQALPFIRQGDRLLDIGCFDQAMIQRALPRLKSAVGVDPLVEPSEKTIEETSVRILKGTVPGSIVLAESSFDAITMLAVLEHIPDTAAVAGECARLLAPKGRVIITVPKPQVDHILAVLQALRLIKGMSLEEHHGYDVRQTRPIFERAGLTLVKEKSFELGLNCLFVFEKA